MVSGESMPKVVYDISESSTPLSTGYALTFIVGKQSELKAYITGANGDTVIDSANYTLSSDAEGVVATLLTFATAYTFPEGATRLTLTREVEITQDINLSNGERINADTLEEGLDNNCRISLMLAERLKRTVKMSISEEEEAPTFPGAKDRAGKILAFDENGNFDPVLTSDVEQKLAEALAAEEATLGYKTDAANSAATATTKAKEAANSAATALLAKESASTSVANCMQLAQSAQYCQTKAEEAKSGAETAQTAAANSATEAAKQEKLAEEAALLASDKEASAETHAEFCVQLKDDTNTLKTEAEASALNAAQSASEAKETKAAMDTAIETAKTDINSTITQAKSDITTLKDAASSSATAAATSATNAATSEANASTSEANAKTYKENAESSASSAETSKTETATLKAEVESIVGNVAAFTVESDGMVYITYEE